jgi:hypothetical protein
MSSEVGEVVARIRGGRGQGLSEITAKVELSRARRDYPGTDITIEDAGFALNNGKPAKVIIVRAKVGAGGTASIMKG